MSFRIDRLATLYLFGPLTRLTGRVSGLPILMYHSIADEDESGAGAYFRTATHPDMFAVHMEMLYQAGYTAVTVSEAVERLRDGSKNIDKTVAITFDDGYRNFYSNAFPILQCYGFTATMYLPTDFIASAARRFKDRDCLNWSEVRELRGQGIAFGSHTMSHPKLYGMGWAEIRKELTGSREVIEQEMGSEVESFAYPYAFPVGQGQFKSALRDVLKDCGYSTGVCTVVGTSNGDSDPFFLERLPVNSADDPRLFQAKLSGAYDWLRKPQGLLKRTKSILDYLPV